MKFTDDIIINGILTNDERILNWMYQQYADKVFGFVKNNKGLPQDGQEVLQETVVTVYYSLQQGKYKHQNKFERYFVKTAMNIWSNKRRKRERRNEQQLENQTYKYAQLENPMDIAEELAAKEQQYELIEKTIQKLKERCQNLLKAFYIQRQKLKDIARTTHQKEGTIRTQISRCRDNLRKMIQKEL